MAAACYGLPPGGFCQSAPPDSLKPHTLPPITVSVTRAALPLSKIPLAVHTVDRSDISLGRPTWGLDEALFHVPGVFAANRYNFSLDQRISIRGFGSRSAFAIRGVKVLVDGIPQTLPDGQGQLTNVELGDADRIEVLRGAASSLFGNASGGVISIWTSPVVPDRLTQEVRVVGGAFDRENRRGWTKWQSTSAFPLGRASAAVTVSRLDYEGERDHTEADLRNLNARLRMPLSRGWTLAVVAEVGDQPVANNPGALTQAEDSADRNSAARLNRLRRAGKDVLQVQGGATLKRGDASITVFGLRRDLTNPLPQAYITFDRWAYGARASAVKAGTLAGRPARLTAGLDLQWQRDDRRNFSYLAPITAATTTPDNRTDSLILSQVERVSEAGPFLQSLVELSPRVSLTAGLRYDRVSFSAADRHLSDGADDSGVRRMSALSWSLGLAATPGGERAGEEGAVTAYANVGTSFETPTTTELANRPTGAGGFNPGLDPQLATNLEVGARGTIDGGETRARWSVALFQASVRDELVSFEVPDDSIFPGRRFFRNAGRARHRGVELGADVGLGPRVDVLVSWTYSDFRYTAYQVGTFDLAGKAIPGVPRNVLHLGLRARPAPLRGGWLHLDVAHTDGVSVDDTLGTTTGSWWVANARAGWDGSVGGLRLSPFVGLNNVFDAHYVGSVVINAARGRYYEPAPGRNLYIGLSLGGSPLEPGVGRRSSGNTQRR